MNIEKLKKTYLPMSETAYYILLSLVEPCHGYGIILKVEDVTKGRLRIGAGTIYGTLTKFEADKMIEYAGEEDRKKIYKITDNGRKLLRMEYARLQELLENGNKCLEGLS